MATRASILEPVKWESPEEWEIEQRVFDAANHPDLPDWIKVLVADLWRQYCFAAKPKDEESNENS